MSPYPLLLLVVAAAAAGGSLRQNPAEGNVKRSENRIQELLRQKRALHGGKPSSAVPAQAVAATAVEAPVVNHLAVQHVSARTAKANVQARAASTKAVSAHAGKAVAAHAMDKVRGTGERSIGRLASKLRTSHSIWRMGNESVQPTPSPDLVAKQDFVRECTVAVSVKSRDMLPDDALKEFCESTDAIMECRLRIVEPLKAAHQLGGNMMVFCESAYHWFQTKYGMYCPAQCEKDQCKPTCNWLKEKKALDEEDQELSEGGTDIDADQEELQRLETALITDRDAAEMRNRSAAQKGVQATRANTTLQEKNTEYNTQLAESQRVDNEVQHREEQKEQYALNISSKEDELADLQRRIDRKNVDKRLVEDDIGRLRTRVETENSRAAEFQQGIEQKNQEAAALNASLADEQAHARDLESQIETATADVETKRVNLESAQSQVQEQRDAAVPNQERIIELEDLETQMRQRFDDATDAFRRLDRQKQSADISIQHAQQDLDAHRSETAQVQNQTDEQNRLVVSLNEEIEEKEEGVRNHTAVAEALIANETEDTLLLDESKSARDRNERTLELQLGYQQEEHDKLQADATASQEAQEAFALAQAELEQEQTHLTAAASELAESLRKVEEERAAYDSRNAGLSGRVAEHSEKVHDLELRKPEIVRIHGLGLIELLGGY